jgi:hypothetical protein
VMKPVQAQRIERLWADVTRHTSFVGEFERLTMCATLLAVFTAHEHC